MRKQHGDYRLGADGRIIIVQFIGEWNSEGSIECTRRIERVIESLEGRPFGVVADTFDFQGAIEEANRGLRNRSRSPGSESVR